MILPERLTVLFPAVEEAGGKLFPGNCGHKEIGRPGSVRGSGFRPPPNPSFLLHSLQGTRGDETRRVAFFPPPPLLMFHPEGDKVQSITCGRAEAPNAVPEPRLAS